MLALVAACPALAALPGDRKASPTSAIKAYDYATTTPDIGVWRVEGNRAVLTLAELGSPVEGCNNLLKQNRFFSLPLKRSGLLGARTTRLTVAWTATKSGVATAGLRIDANDQHHNHHIVDLAREARGSLAGRLVTIDVPAASVREWRDVPAASVRNNDRRKMPAANKRYNDSLDVTIWVSAQCACKPSSANVRVDQLQLEVLP